MRIKAKEILASEVDPQLLDQYFGPLLTKWEMVRNRARKKMDKGNKNAEGMFLAYSKCIDQVQKFLEEIKTG